MTTLQASGVGMGGPFLFCNSLVSINKSNIYKRGNIILTNQQLSSLSILQTYPGKV